MNFETSDIINSNGQRYRVGWDEHGWFSIQMVDENPFFESEPDSGPRWIPVEDENGSPYPPVSFTPDGAEQLKQLIEER